MSMYLHPDQAEALRALSQRSRIPAAILVREAVDDLLRKHNKENDDG